LFAANDTDGAKAVAEELRAKGVRLFDGRRTWTTATAPPDQTLASRPSAPTERYRDYDETNLARDPRRATTSGGLPPIVSYNRGFVDLLPRTHPKGLPRPSGGPFAIATATTTALPGAPPPGAAAMDVCTTDGGRAFRKAKGTTPKGSAP